MPSHTFLLVLTLVVVSGWWAQASAEAGGAERPTENLRIRDLLWVWGNPEMAEPGQHTLATFANASPAERAQLLGVPNVAMAGLGLPRDDAQAFALTADVAGSPHLVWEISTDDESGGPPFAYDETIGRVRKLAAEYPQIEGVLLDDMSTVQIDRGFLPEHIRQIRGLLGDTHDQVKVWGVLYTMTLDRENIRDYIDELDVINLWTWHAKDVVDLEANVARCETLFPGKPIVVGLYLYDYGDGRRMPLDLHQRQCATALELAHAGRVQGIVLLTIKDDPDILAWTADWVARVGGQKVGAPPAGTPDLSIADGAAWHFPAGDWTQDAEGVIRPPDRRNLHSRAFYTAQGFADLSAEFEFNGDYRETGTGSAGLVLRASDVNHFYLVYFPWGGQQLRAKHFWAAIAKVDGDGYLRHLAAEWIPGVPSETDRWYKVRVEAEGPNIRVWVDGRRALSVTDDAYASGCVGLAGYGWYRFRNVRISGAEASPPAWDRSAAIPTHTFTVGLTSDKMPSGCVAPNGDVLLAAGNQLVRSKDKGRTWEAPETLPEKLGEITDYGSTMFRTSDGRLIAMLYRTQAETEKPTPEIAIAESSDNGLTWSDPTPAQVAPDWPAQPKSLTPYGPLVENRDGILMRFLLGGVKEEGTTYTDVRTWGSIHCKAYVIRSADAGASWSAPIELDRPSWCDKPRGSLPGSLDFTEPTAVVIGDTVTALIRPVYSPMMWQCWSYDGGATWDAASRATFPGYAQSMVRTASGAIVCAHRYPHYAVNVSHDDGLHWDAGTVIDYPVWAMGCIIEVEPDLLLCTYMNADRGQPLLAQLVRVTTDGIAPDKGGNE